MVLAVFVQIISRALFNMSFPWTEELARYLMIWVTFLGASFAFQYGAHISIEAFVTRLKKTMVTNPSRRCSHCLYSILFYLNRKGH